MYFLIMASLLLQPADFFLTDFDEIIAQAGEAYQSGDYSASAEYYLQFLQHNARDAGALYNLACCYGLMGDEVAARDFALLSLKAGFDDIGWMSWDPDFDSVRDGELFSAFMDSVTVAAEEELARQGTVIHVLGEVMLPCLVKFPENYDPDTPTPLLIGLHGYGASPQGFVRLWEAFEEPDFIYAVPQAPYPRYQGAVPGHSWMIWSDDEEFSVETAIASYGYITQVTTVLQEKYNISDTYLMGFSQGCGFTLETGLFAPELYTGLIGFGGWLDTTIVTPADLEAASGIRVFLAHGTEDTAVEFQGGQDAFNYLDTHGIDVVFHPFEGGHTVDREVLLKAQEWMAR